MNSIKNILWILFFVIFCPIYLVFSSLKYIVTGKNIIGKLAILSSYAGIVALAVLKPFAFWIVFGILALLDLVVALLMTKSGTTNKTNESENGNSEYHSQSGCKIPFFDGMTVEEAKKEYRKLMKMYHPDNANGDEEMSKKVSAAYNQYRTAFGR